MLGKIKNNRGQSIVELAILLPVLVMIMLGILQLGLVFNAYTMISNGAREGARTAAVGGDDSAVLVSTGANTSNLNADKLAVTITPSAGSRVSGDAVVVNISYDVDVIVPLIGGIIGNPIELNASSTMRVE